MLPSRLHGECGDHQEWQCLGLRGERGGNDFVDPLMFGSRKQRGVVWFIRFIRFHERHAESSLHC